MRFPRHPEQIPLSPPDAMSDGERPASYVGHAHFWERAISRRAVIGSAALGTAAVLGSGFINPELVSAHEGFSPPTPIPEVIFPGTPFHVQFPGTEEPSSIYNFNGFVAATEIQGTGTDGLLFDADMRFMRGSYVAVDGKVHHDTFGFV